MKLLVIDSTNSLRGKENAKPFKFLLKDVYFYDGTEVILIENEYPVNLSGKIDVIILHDKNENLINELNIKSDLIIRYTGGDPPDTKEKYWIQQRAIETKADAITKKEASQIIDWIKNGCSEEYLPILLKPPQTKELITSIFIFCMGYLSAGVGAGAINDEEVKILIGWNDQVKKISPNTDADWKAGWKKVKKPQWWDDLEKINNLKEKVRIEMDGNLDKHLEKLIDFIKGKGTIEHFETVKTVLKILKEKIWS